MLKNNLCTLALVSTGITLSLTAISAKPAQATRFHLGGFPSLSSSFDYSKEGIDLTITAGSTAGPRNVARGFLGVGVKGGFLDDPELDGLGPNEALFLDFNKKISLVSATFSRVGFNDDFQLFVDGDFLVEADIPGGNIFDRGIGTFRFKKFAPDNQGTSFAFTVAGKNDDYFLKKVKVKVVPEPASLLGLLAVGAFGVSSATKSKKSKQEQA